jgi:hypothetical protein
MRISRRQFLSGAVACAASAWSTHRALAGSGQIWGAIRWDAWWGSSPDSIEAERDLWPSKWQNRAPAWAKKSQDPEKLEFAPTSADLDHEIAAAHAAGLKFWAYDYYPTSIDNDFMNALKYHRNSKLRNELNYCLIVPMGHHWGGENDYKSVNASVVEMAKDDFYQKAHGRPVVFLFWNEAAFKSVYKSQMSEVAGRLADLRSQMSAAGLANPYVGVMQSYRKETVTAIGADALATYAVGPAYADKPVGFASFALTIRKHWADQLQTGAQVVPTAMTGWDLRAMADNPPGFYKPYLPKNAQTGYVVPASPAEVARLVQDGVDFIREHPSQCPEKLGLIYSWDECIEGGNVLDPTLGDPEGHLLATVGSLIK